MMLEFLAPFFDQIISCYRYQIFKILAVTFLSMIPFSILNAIGPPICGKSWRWLVTFILTLVTLLIRVKRGLVMLMLENATCFVQALRKLCCY